MDLIDEVCLVRRKQHVKGMPRMTLNKPDFIVDSFWANCLQIFHIHGYIIWKV